jgi:hypothetical protein
LFCFVCCVCVMLFLLQWIVERSEYGYWLTVMLWLLSGFEMEIIVLVMGC